jgi:hypothetical protein
MEEKEKADGLENEIIRGQQSNNFNMNLIITESDVSEIESEYQVLTIMLKALNIEHTPVEDDVLYSPTEKSDLQNSLEEIFSIDYTPAFFEKYKDKALLEFVKFPEEIVSAEERSEEFIKHQETIKEELKKDAKTYLNIYEYIKKKLRAIKRIVRLEDTFDEMIATHLVNFIDIKGEKCLSTSETSYFIFEILKSNIILNEKVFLTKFYNDYWEIFGDDAVKELCLYNSSTIFTEEQIDDIGEYFEGELVELSGDDRTKDISAFLEKYLSRYILVLRIYKYDTDFNQNKKEESLNPIENFKRKLSSLTVLEIKDAYNAEGLTNAIIATKIGEKVGALIAAILEQMETNPVLVILIEELVILVVELLAEFILEFLGDLIFDIMDFISGNLSDKKNKKLFGVYFKNLDADHLMNIVKDEMESGFSFEIEHAEINPLELIEKRLFHGYSNPYNEINAMEYDTLIDFPDDLFKEIDLDNEDDDQEGDDQEVVALDKRMILV